SPSAPRSAAAPGCAGGGPARARPRAVAARSAAAVPTGRRRRAAGWSRSCGRRPRSPGLPPRGAAAPPWSARPCSSAPTARRRSPPRAARGVQLVALGLAAGGLAVARLTVLGAAADDQRLAVDHPKQARPLGGQDAPV